MISKAPLQQKTILSKQRRQRSRYRSRQRSNLSKGDKDQDTDQDKDQKELDMPLAHTDSQGEGGDLLHRLWIYTNYDCNLSCSYCVAESYVGADRRGLDTAQVRRLIDEAAALSLHDLFLTGGEPFILHDIFSMLAYGLERMHHVTVLSNGILLKGNRLEQLAALPHRERLTIQISLDGSRADLHD